MSIVKLTLMVAMYAQFSAGDMVEFPEAEMPPVQELGLASWYGDGNWHGDQTANGERFDPDRFTCAHRALPFDTMVLIVNRANKRRVWCRINDRGPYGARLPDGSWGVRLSREEHGHWRGIIDMSVATAQALGTIDKGLQSVELRYWKPNGTKVFNLAAIDLQYP